MSISQEFGSGSPLVLRGVVDGEQKEIVLNLGRLTLATMGNFSSWAQDVVIARARRLAGELPESGREYAIRRAVDIVTKESDWGGPVCEALLRSPTGIAKLIHLLLDPVQRKEFSVELILSLIDATESEPIQAALFRAAGVSAADAERIKSKAETKRTDP